MRRQFLADERGTRTVITHVLAIGIVSILIVGLILTTSSYLTDQKEHAAREELRTIGNRLANEITQLDRLSVHGGDATLRTSHPDRISGASYNARIATGSDCDTAAFSTSSCLVIWSDELDVTQKIPLKTSSQTDIDIDQGEPGEFTLTSDVTGGPSAQVRHAGVTELSMRVGVGRDVRPTNNGNIVNPANEEPVPKFTFEPGSPDSATTMIFNASKSQDLDGTIIEYRWDFDPSTAGPEKQGPSPTTTYDFAKPGYREVTLTVVDDDGAKASVAKNISVSGLVYNDDLDTTSDTSTMRFTLTNDWASRDVVIRSLRIDPTNDNVGELDQVYVDGTSSQTEDTSGSTIPSGGLIVDGFSVTVGAGDTATVELRDFQNHFDVPVSMDGEELEVAIRHDVPSQQTNTTVFTDVPGGPGISDYYLTSTPSGVELSFESTAELDVIEVDLQDDANIDGRSPDLTRSDFTETYVGGAYKYEATVPASNSPGTYVAKLHTVESASGTPGGNLPQTDALTISSGFEWTDAAHWDAATSEQGTVHDNYGGRSADRIQLGYPIDGTTWDDGLLAYWPLDETSGTTATDATGNGNDGTIEDATLGSDGILGRTSYTFDGDDYVSGATDIQALRETASLSAWIKTTQDGSYYFWHAPGITGVESASDGNDIFWGWLNGDGRIGMRTGNGATALSDDPINDGDWHHVVLTRDENSGEVKVYVDGSLDETDHSWTGTPTTTFSSIGRIENSGESFEGKIDELRVYDKVLSNSEVRALYETRTSGTMLTNWKTASSAYQPSNLDLKYAAAVDSGEEVHVTVQSDTDGDGNPDDSSGTIKLTDGDTGTGLKNVPPAGMGASDTYRLKIELVGSTSTDGPEVDELELKP